MHCDGNHSDHCHERQALSKVIVRPATREDIEAFSAAPQKPTMKAWVGELDGRLIGIGGLAFSHGRWFVFCDLTDEARQYKVTIAKTALTVMKEARRMGLKYVYAEIEDEEPAALRWQRSLGFELDERSGFLMKWRP